jgi:hypothetical protein
MPAGSGDVPETVPRPPALSDFPSIGRSLNQREAEHTRPGTSPSLSIAALDKIKPIGMEVGKWAMPFPDDPKTHSQKSLRIGNSVMNHGPAQVLTQEKLSCLLLDTTYGLSYDEFLWTTLDSWASFQPRRAQPRTTPGRLYYPAEFSLVFEKYWDHLPDLTQSPDFASDSSETRVDIRSTLKY